MITIEHHCPRNFALVDPPIRVRDLTKDGLENTEMNVKKAEKSPERQLQQQQSSSSQTASLNDRYGKIGISAVAGACQHKKGEKRRSNESRFVPHESD